MITKKTTQKPFFMMILLSALTAIQAEQQALTLDELGQEIEKMVRSTEHSIDDACNLLHENGEVELAEVIQEFAEKARLMIIDKFEIDPVETPEKFTLEMSNYLAKNILPFKYKVYLVRKIGAKKATKLATMFIISDPEDIYKVYSSLFRNRKIVLEETINTVVDGHSAHTEITETIEFNDDKVTMHVEEDITIDKTITSFQDVCTLQSKTATQKEEVSAGLFIKLLTYFGYKKR